MLWDIRHYISQKTWLTEFHSFISSLTLNSNKRNYRVYDKNLNEIEFISFFDVIDYGIKKKNKLLRCLTFDNFKKIHLSFLVKIFSKTSIFKFEEFYYSIKILTI